ncbi:MAG: glycosyl transferase [Ferruginibacter sp.]|uniref:glycosyltransferase n=1 Tax=Ferruginibacter sp. TaxID=1940288 RepID=UPI00265A17E6|nr:glycosyltransferase [Ferruginibacter sp.]MDB5280357.1 glycosyl transferase [Ferruginibacter sp.]
MKDVIVSIIVPVFNAEKYLEQCIISILNQTLTAIEVVIINDGSTDGSINIMRDYSQRDERIILIDSINKGVSAARNAGIKIAKGRFVGFVDADDFVEAAMYEKLYQSAIQHDSVLIICNAAMEENNLSSRPRLHLKDDVIEISKDSKTVLLDFLRFKYDYANWNKLYSLELIRKHRISFNEKMSMWEDILFNLIYLQFVTRAVILKDCYYHYRIQPSSITASTNIGFGKQYNLFFESFASFCSANAMTGQLSVFKDELSENCIATILLFIRRSLTKGAGFFKLFLRFRTELKDLNPELYLTEPCSFKSGKFQYLLLKKNFLTVYSFVYVAEPCIKNVLRSFLKRNINK